MKTLQQLQDKLDAILDDVEMTEAGIAGIDLELLEESKRCYLKAKISAANGYLSELWAAERQRDMTA